MNECVSSIHLCRVRVTRLDSVGNPAPGPNNVYVTDKLISLGFTPVITAGADIELVGGCDCLVASFRGDDKLKRFDLAIALAQIEPALLEMMVGATAIIEAGAIQGFHWPSQISCDDPQQPYVALEAWSDAWEDDHPADVGRYWHWIWPGTKWQIGEATLENGFAQPAINGWTRGNPQWGEGIFGDYPEPINAGGGAFRTDVIPAPFCGYQTEGLT